jgi:hypothetical protein
MFQFFNSLTALQGWLISSYNTLYATPASLHVYGLGIFPVRSPLLGESLICFLFLEVLRWFTSLRSPSHTYVFSVESPESPLAGLPHSDICGSKPARDSPQLFAACHVLLRLWMPRHSPYALSSLTINLYRTLQILKISQEDRNVLNSNARIAFAIDAHQCYISFLFPVVPFYSIFKELSGTISRAHSNFNKHCRTKTVSPGNSC